MTYTDTRAVPLAERTTLGLVGLQWTPVIAGAIVAAALAFVLHSFALAVGLSLTSTAPTWRDASFALVFLSGLYVILAALAAYGFGAYVAARLRSRLGGVPAEDLEFGDGMHGLAVWALATLLTGLLALASIWVVKTPPLPLSTAMAKARIVKLQKRTDGMSGVAMRPPTPTRMVAFSQSMPRTPTARSKRSLPVA